MSHCAVFGCNNTLWNKKEKPGKLSFFRFPADSGVRAKWINACRRRDRFSADHARICSVHFEKDAFFKSMQQQLLRYSPKNCRKLKQDAVPTLFLPLTTGEREVARQRRDRTEVRAKRKLINLLLHDNAEENRPVILEGTSSIPSHLCQSEAGASSHGCVASDFDFDNNPLNILVKASEIVGYVDIPQSNVPDQPIVDAGRMAALEEENVKLMERNKLLQEENSLLKQKLQVLERQSVERAAERVKEILSPFFSEGQIKHLLNPGKRMVWSKSDISSAISLRYVSAKAYRYLREHLNFPLPCVTTLKSWVSKYDFSCGIQKNVLGIMKIRGEHLTDLERWTVLSYDEMKVSSELCLDRKNEQILGPCDQVQTVMARGLFGKWKQPVFYDYDQAMTKSILFSVIEALEDIGFKVVAQVSDMGPSNQGLWKSLGVNTDCSHFLNPVDPSRKIFVFADVPHLLKLLRNHFIDSGLVYPNGVTISASLIHKLYSLKNELNIIPKITHEHLNPSPFRRQKVKLATQLFSHTVSSALQYCHDNKYLVNDVSDLARFVKLVNDFFDIFNSTVLFDQRGPRHAYGTSLSEQNRVLSEMTEVMTSVRVLGSKSLQPFQKGIILSIKSLLGLYSVAESSGANFILTAKLNQDVLESFFSYIRGIGRTSDHPNAVDWKYRFRAFIMGKHSEAIITSNTNTTDISHDRCLVGFDEDGEAETEGIIEEECITTDILNDLLPTDVVGQEEDEDHLIPNGALCDSRSLEGDSLVFIAGYVASRFKAKYSWLGDNTRSLEQPPNDWVRQLSRGGLIHPTKEFMEVIQCAERAFSGMHGKYICRERDVFLSLTKRVMAEIGPEWPEEVLSLFVRTRTYIRLKFLNMCIKGEGGRQLKKKLKKVKQ